MLLFGFGRTKKPPARRSPHRKITFKQALDQVLVKKAQSDEDWAFQAALSHKGLQEKPEDPVKKRIHVVTGGSKLVLLTVLYLPDNIMASLAYSVTEP